MRTPELQRVSTTVLLRNAQSLNGDRSRRHAPRRSSPAKVAARDKPRCQNACSVSLGQRKIDFRDNRCEVAEVP